MISLIIDEEFKNLIPPLSDSEIFQLEENVLRYGIQDPLKVWNGILIDGHNRYSIAQKHGLDFKVEEMNFDSRADVIDWIIKNQFGRRNISTYDRVVLALKLKPVIAAKAKENSLANLKQSLGEKNSDMPILASRTTNEQIAKIAGVGKETIRKVEKILEISKTVKLDDVISGLKRNEFSINLAYEAAIIRKQKLDSIEEKLIQSWAALQETEKALWLYYKELKQRLASTSKLEERKKTAALIKGLEATLKSVASCKIGTEISKAEYETLVADAKEMDKIFENIDQNVA